MKEDMIQETIRRVNELNGGPVSEGKVLKMIEEERVTHIKEDIEAMH